MTAKTFARGDKKRISIEIMEQNADKDFFTFSDMIGEALDLNKYAARAYFKYNVKEGLVKCFAPTDTPWKTAKSALKEAKASARKPKADKAPAKKAKKEPTPAPEAGKASIEVTVSTSDEKPATKMIRDFVKKQKAAKAAA